MRYPKITSVVATAGLALLLLVAASSASATALCKKNANPCAVADIYPNNSILEAKLAGVTNLEIATDAGTIKCSQSELTGKWHTDGSGEYTTGEVSKVTTPKCEEPPVACVKNPSAVVAQHLPYSASVSAAGGGNGTLTLGSGGSGKPAFKVECGALECTFSANAVPFEVTGGASAKAKLTGSKLEWEGPKCPKLFATLTVEYEVTNPAPPAELFIEGSVAPPVLCKKLLTPCSPAAEIWTVPETFEGEFAAATKFVYTYLGEAREPSCTFSKFKTKTTAAGKPITGEVSSLTFETCAGGACNVTATGLAYEVEIDRAGGGNGTEAWSKLLGTEPTIKIKCGLTEECIYKASSIEWTLTGGATATLATPGKVSLAGSSVGCSSTATWQGVGGVNEVKYNFSLPKNVFVTS